MTDKYLPTLKRLSIRNYSLYPANLDFTYEFIQGINLVIGGNGVGKTTFLNIIKYALIGLYKKELDVKRREYRGVETRYDKRVNLPYNYFRNRMDDDADYNESAEVTLVFTINKVEFSVTRSLYEPAITSVNVKEGGNNNQLAGAVISQSEYDNLFLDKKNNSKIYESLQWAYEEKMGQLSNHENFDNIIFLFNDVLFFNETRKTIMWDGVVQAKLSSKYFIDPKLDGQKEEAERDGKYFDSLARHKSEDIRAINKIFEKINEDDSDSKHYKDFLAEIDREKRASDAFFKELERIQKDRNKTEQSINSLHNEKNAISKRVNELESAKRIEEQQIFSNIFKKVTPKYYDYLKYLKTSKECPLCNNELPSNIYDKVMHDDSRCMMCSNAIINPQLASDGLLKLKEQITNVQNSQRQKEREIINEEDSLKDLDERFQKTNIALNASQSKLRRAEFNIQKFQQQNKSAAGSEFQAMKARIDELEKEKTEAQQTSRNAYKKADSILDKIDKQRLESREKLSGIFNKFGGQFLGLPCELTYEDPADGLGKRYLPKINGDIRYEEEELSESQRFFIDQSFRMSMLSYFNSRSFFMCETPDSSLDLSYEQNAAKIFLEYLRQPNSLIITSNLNNSDFLNYLIEKASAINYINLLKIGRQSSIQATSSALLKASNKIEKIIDGKRK